jgi:hypothetical protein
MMGIDKTVRNEIVQILSARPALLVMALKQVHRYYDKLQQDKRGRLAERVVKWAMDLDDPVM